jgi:hypothetical protein
MFPLCKDFVVTDGVKNFVKEAEAQWLIDIVGSYIPKIAKIDDYFFKVNLKVNKECNNDGLFRILHEVHFKMKCVVEQNIPYVDLPSGEYTFYLFKEGELGQGLHIMICPGEY